MPLEWATIYYSSFVHRVRFIFGLFGPSSLCTHARWATRRRFTLAHGSTFFAPPHISHNNTTAKTERARAHTHHITLPDRTLTANWHETQDGVCSVQRKQTGLLRPPSRNAAHKAGRGYCVGTPAQPPPARHLASRKGGSPSRPPPWN